MSPATSWIGRLAVVGLCCMAMLPQTSALAVEYCSDINTSGNAKNISTYQSNGLCSLFCQADYAFAILQNNGCWCSDYAPATNTTGCTTSCPGYPSDLCGGSDVYGYIALTNAVLGTKGASSSTTAAQVTVTAFAEPQTILQTVTETPTLAATTSLSAAAATTPTTARTTSRSITGDTSSTWTPTPITSLETVTGQVRTVTVTPTAPPNAGTSTTIQKTNKSSGLSTGAAVGLTIGLVALLAILVSIVYFCFQKRQKEKNREYEDASPTGSGNGFPAAVPTRSMSESSRYVLNTDGRRVVESWEEENQLGSRRSRLMATVDPRLDPFAKVYQRAADSKSRESVNTIRDDQDYSRRINQQGPILRATNPDPDMMGR